MIVNHIGMCVRDLDASSRFYEALGFTPEMRLEVPDEAAGPLISLDPPIGLTAAYLVNGPVVLELMVFADQPPTKANDRTITEAGLTHLSIGVDDMDAAKQAAAEAGGEVLASTDVGVAVMVRDPDGQLIELLHVDYRPVSPSA